ncbi:hypothetical protein F4778DRAFT_786226 [Xylariomycetidae sp. FL2044]|nr:hypothetical protein F4778DRAFT_786226 [Xylariomycetidae sp. FL2044]
MAKGKSGLTASAKAIDPTLDSLFTSSAGPVQLPSTSRYSELLPLKERKPLDHLANGPSKSDDELEDQDDSEASEDDDDDDDDDNEAEIGDESMKDEELAVDNDPSSEDEAASEIPSPAPKKERKRKRKDDHDDLEDNYMRKLAEEDEKENPSGKRRKGSTDPSVSRDEAPEPASDEEQTPLVHESLLHKSEEHVDIELDKANRTLFLGNVSAEAISSSKAKKTLMSHLASPMSDLDAATGPHKVESLRFRSTAFSTGALPKRAAFITKSVMDATTKSTNAYVVYTTSTAARAALKALNGSIILDRHMRVDSVAHPSAIAHRRCVFVGNLGFVNDETVINTTAEGETTTKKRTKVPADVEEGLWRTFGEQAGKVESVRVPRDPKTRVGKGFAYVQFYDANDVESALLLDGKKFPPMLPRALRVSRAKDPRKTTLAMERTQKTKLESLKGGDGKAKSTKHKPKITPEVQSLAGRAGRLFGRAGAARQRHEMKKGGRNVRERQDMSGKGTIKAPEDFVFEGRRASANDGKPRDLKFGKGKGKKGVVKSKTKSRGAKRAAEWRKKGSN